MKKFTNPLNHIRVASPCKADWNEMIGNQRQRFCAECKLNVYNLSGMSKREAENLLIESEGRVCVRFYRRSDGSILTTDCPVGWRAIKRRASKMAAAFASLIFGILGGLGLNGFFGQSNSKENLRGKIEINSNNSKVNAKVKVQSTPILVMGNVAPRVEDVVEVGRIVVEKPKVKPKQK